jgi:hypothetical protein
MLHAGTGDITGVGGSLKRRTFPLNGVSRQRLWRGKQTLLCLSTHLPAPKQTLSKVRTWGLETYWETILATVSKGEVNQAGQKSIKELQQADDLTDNW